MPKTTRTGIKWWQTAHWQRVLVGTAVTLGIYVALWRLFAIHAQHMRPWIELLNGATWPDKVNELYDENVSFAAVLALRTLLNLSALIVVVLLIWDIVFIAASTKAESVMDMWHLLSSLDAEIVSKVMQRLDISGEESKLLQDAVQEARREWAEEQLPVLIGREKTQELLAQQV